MFKKTNYVLIKGLTLLEMMLACALSAILFTLLFFVSITANRMYQEQMAYISVEQQALSALAMLKNKIKSEQDIFLFSVENTHRRKENGVPIYGLYYRDHAIKKEMVEGIDHLSVSKDRHENIVIQLVVSSLTNVNFSYKWYLPLRINHVI